MDKSNARYLVYFESIYRNQGIRSSAEELGVSPPTLSRICDKLEAIVGNRLFEKRGNKFVSTYYADVLYNEIINPINELQMAYDEVGKSKKKLCILAPPYLSISTFFETKEEFKIVLGTELIINFCQRPYERNMAYQELRRGNVDILIDTMIPDSWPWAFDYHVIYSDQLVYFCSINCDLPEEGYVLPCKELCKYIEDKSAKLNVIDNYRDFISIVANSNLIGVTCLKQIENNNQFKVIGAVKSKSGMSRESNIYIIYDKSKYEFSSTIRWFVKKCVDSEEISFR